MLLPQQMLIKSSRYKTCGRAVQCCTPFDASDVFGQLETVAQSGEKCHNPVNTAECRYCEFHVASAYRKLQPSRGGFLDSMLSTAFSRGPARPQAQGAGDLRSSV